MGQRHGIGGVNADFHSVALLKDLAVPLADTVQYHTYALNSGGFACNISRNKGLAHDAALP